MRFRSTLVLAVVAGLLVLAPAAPAAPAASCAAAVPYPGDTAAKEAIAGWMAGGAAARGLPGELPVMAALVESGLANLPADGSDSAGYFQMRKSIWSAGYPGFPKNPELQLDWFLDQAAAVRTAPYPPETAYGEWVADVERPAARYRSRYQPRLAEARTLIGAACAVADTAAPVAELTASTRQRALEARALQVSVACPAEPCTVDVRARVRVGAQRELVAAPAPLAAGQVATFAVRLKPAVRRLVARALGLQRKVRADLTVTTTDAAGNAAVAAQRVRITG